MIVYRPDYLFILYGTNDLAGEADPFKDFSVSYERLLETLVKELPETHIACSELLWRGDYSEDQIKTFSKIINEKCQKFSIPYCQPFDWLGPEDFYDGLHPNPKGHKKIANNLKIFFKEIYPKLRS